jgi:hypothetical protein
VAGELRGGLQRHVVRAVGVTRLDDAVDRFCRHVTQAEDEHQLLPRGDGHRRAGKRRGAGRAGVDLQYADVVGEAS